MVPGELRTNAKGRLELQLNFNATENNSYAFECRMTYWVAINGTRTGQFTRDYIFPLASPQSVPIFYALD